MRVNEERKSMDMEARDWNFIMPQYLKAYLYRSRNNLPKEVIFPMFTEVIDPNTQQKIPVRWIDPYSGVAQEIARDGRNVPEVTEEEEKVIDKVEETVAAAREEAVLPQPEAEPTPEPAVEEQIQSEVKEEPSTATAKPSRPADKAFGDSKPPTYNVGTDQPPADRVPRGPERPAEAGEQLSDMSPPSAERDQRLAQRDMADEPDINEDEEIEAKIRTEAPNDNG
jgi:hypothetical protein|tara:strand:+ start:3039 stop:3713 length:675 start_codon:yes stop_codon:yes gene_type:complete